MSCIIHNIGAQVWIDRGIQIIYESTKKASTTQQRIEGTIVSIDKEKHTIKVYAPELKENIIIDAGNVKKKA